MKQKNQCKIQQIWVHTNKFINVKCFLAQMKVNLWVLEKGCGQVPVLKLQISPTIFFHAEMEFFYIIYFPSQLVVFDDFISTWKCAWGRKILFKNQPYSNAYQCILSLGAKWFNIVMIWTPIVLFLEYIRKNWLAYPECLCSTYARANHCSHTHITT